MADRDKMQELVQRIISDAFESHLPGLRYDLVRRILQELHPTTPTPAGESPSELLNAALASLHEATSQAEILNALLEACSRFAHRTALFALRGAAALGWRARGFRDNDAFRNFAVDATHGLAARAVQTLKLVSGAQAEFEARAGGAWGAPADGICVVLPLVVRDKTVALIYADQGGDARGTIDVAALELLVRSAGTWLEVLALRKAAGIPARIDPTLPHAEAVTPPAVPQAAPVAAMAAAAGAPVAPSPASAVATAPAPDSPAAISPEEEGTHIKARRFAKLLVEEIKLYNQAKVAEGRQNKDLYARLKEDIEKSRSTYDKRYGGGPASKADYFTQELVRILADNNVELLGSSFPR